MRKLHLGVALLFLESSAVRAQEAPPPVPTKPSNEVRPAIRWKQFNYTCEGGARLTVYLHNETAKVRHQEHVYVMTQTRSADGNRYSDGKVVWWGKRNGGFLEEDAPDGNGKMLVKGCQLEKPLNASAVADKVTGTVAYLQRIALPPNAIIQVQLQAAKTIAQEKITLGDRQIPVPFEIKVDAEKIDPQHAYALTARIVVDDKLRFVNDKSYPVLTRDNPSHVEMILKAVGEPTGAGAVPDRSDR